MNEQEGYSIEPVKKRIYTFIDIFSIWVGAGIGIGEIWAGATLSPALPLFVAIIVNIVGHAIGNLILGAVAIEGAETGLPTMVLSRGAFGIKGSALPSILNYVQLIGWTGIMIIVGAKAMNAIFEHGFINYYFWVLFFGIIVTIWTLIGPEKWKGIEKISALLLLILSIWIIYVTLHEYSLNELLSHKPTGEIGTMLGLDLVIAMPLSWVPLIADYSRFCKNKKSSFYGSYIGYFISSGLMYFVGSLSNTAYGKEDPISILVAYGFGIPAMIIVIFSTTTTTFLDIYSGAITYKNVFTKSNVKKQIIIVGMLGTALATVFPTGKYEAFLLFVGGAFISMAAIMIVDYFFIKKGYVAGELFKKEGKYWYKNGFNLKAILIWLIGFIFYLLLTMQIPFFSYIGSKIGASIPTFALVAFLYYLFNTPK